MAEFWTSDDFRDSLQSMEADWAGTTLRGLQSLKAGDKLKRDRQYGNGSISIGLPAGTHEGDLEIVTIPGEFDNLAANLGNDMTQIPGTVGVAFRRPNGTIYTVNLTRVYLNEVNLEAGKAGGSDPSLITIPAYVLDPIDWNGLRMIQPKGTIFSFPVALLGI